MPRSRNITLRDAVASGATEFLVYCEALHCEHVSAMPLDEAIVRWGLRAKLNDIAVECPECRSLMVETRFTFPVDRAV